MICKAKVKETATGWQSELIGINLLVAKQGETYQLLEVETIFIDEFAGIIWEKYGDENYTDDVWIAGMRISRKKTLKEACPNKREFMDSVQENCEGFGFTDDEIEILDSRALEAKV
ncbi:hypothetical protein GH810_14300 [Acetobacterium paludosum]|uniref:Uncharacterized protein n=1 Tax=Acetobacterium paludosum TaxID=52693 RepID=A0A923I3W9_9FIRM|nr:hypothetical protein [Acetobacterium paludosum]MBC3889483.1 hypothetical protein [Acetobacterium paludosum]